MSRERRWWFAQVRRDKLLARRAVREGTRPREQLVRQHSPRVEIRAVIYARIARRLLGRHVRRSSNRRTHSAECPQVPRAVGGFGTVIGGRGNECLGDPEVGHDRGSLP